MEERDRTGEWLAATEGSRGTYVAKVCALGGNGKRQDEEEHGELGAEEDLLQVGEDGPEQRDCLTVNSELI
jgi:hypothetical protein